MNKTVKTDRIVVLSVLMLIILCVYFVFLYKLQIVEGEAVYHDGTQFQDVWGTDAILAFTTPASMQEMGSPSYGYTYQLEGRPIVEEGYEDRNANSWVNPVADARKAVLAGASAGFIFKTAVA